MHTYIHEYMHYIHICITYIHTYIHTYMHQLLCVFSVAKYWVEHMERRARVRPPVPQSLLVIRPTLSCHGICACCLDHAPRGLTPLPRQPLYSLGDRSLCIVCWRLQHLTLLLQRLHREHELVFWVLDIIGLLETQVSERLARQREGFDSDLEEYEVVD